MDDLTVIKIPSWFPGARYKRYAREWYPKVVGAVQTPYDKVKRELVSVAGPPLFTTSEIRLFRRPERQNPLSPQTSYRNLTRIQPRKTYGLPGQSQVQCIWLVLTP
jgi:hypothetical protein